MPTLDKRSEDLRARYVKAFLRKYKPITVRQTGDLFTLQTD